MPQRLDFAASAEEPMKLTKIKGSKHASDEDFAASAEEPMKLTKTKGSYRASEAGFCCLRQRPDETRQAQRQQMSLRKQDFAASD